MTDAIEAVHKAWRTPQGHTSGPGTSGNRNPKLEIRSIPETGRRVLMYGLKTCRACRCMSHTQGGSVVLNSISEKAGGCYTANNTSIFALGEYVIVTGTTRIMCEAVGVKIRVTLRIHCARHDILIAFFACTVYERYTTKKVLHFQDVQTFAVRECVFTQCDPQCVTPCRYNIENCIVPVQSTCRRRWYMLPHGCLYDLLTVVAVVGLQLKIGK